MTKLLRSLAWNEPGWVWADRMKYRKEAGYTWRQDLTHIWEKWLVWKILKWVPRPIKYYVVVEVATRNENGNPGYVTASDMLKKYERKEV